MVAPHFLAEDIEALKRAARAAARARRRDWLREAPAGEAGEAGEPPESGPGWAAGAAMAAQLLAAGLVPPGAMVGGCWPLGEEIDLRPLLYVLAARGHALALPVTPPRGQPLDFRAWMPGEALVAGVFGTRHPPAGPAVVPDVLLVPLLAFDRRGHRLGYGGGYYDRTLAAMPGARAIGVAFAVQEVAAVPVGPHDVPLRLIATEAGMIDCEASA